jgi:glycerol-3-phosphate acyltransferase PlsY
VSIMSDVLMPVAGYFCGAIPFGVLIARAKGIDPFTAGSGNVGATNIGRLLGKRWGVFVFLCDFCKGLVPAGLAVWLRGETDAIAVLTGLLAILGHMFSPFLGFRGGKGVATGAWAVSVLLPGPAGLAILAFIATILAGCTMSLASVIAAITLAATQISLVTQFEHPATLFAVVVGALVVFRHRANLSRIFAGTESRLRSLDHWSKLTPGLHALALGLWCGAAWFFSLGVAPKVFDTMKTVVADPPSWFLVRQIDADMGSRLGGTAVAPLFPRYFLLQAICGVIATGTAIGWLITRPGGSAKWRAGLLFVAMILVAIGWPVSRYVSELRALRFDDEGAKAAFGTWHGISLGLNLTVLVLLAPAMMLAGYVRPESPPVATGGQ